MLRVIDACFDGIYGSLHPEVLVVGNDVLVSLALALHLAECGFEVLISPDNLDIESWPNPHYSANNLAIFSTWTDEMAEVLGSRFGNGFKVGSIASAIGALCEGCKQTGRVSIIKDTALQSDRGFCRGAPGKHLLFPLRPEIRQQAGLHPFWKVITTRLPSIQFNHRELEFVSTRLVVLTSHPSRFLHPEASTCSRVGQARVSVTDVSEKGRHNDLRTALALRIT
ncbi:hypothetical protein P4193_01970 [Pseudomonas aeruginosa]|uniref:hypothetical protein n=1 Tax=Pseudomonas aeruginosa TaxID=287 RepID=UPI00191CB238|nr:hypothetical protein [Pseudomonas aeruginosa]MCT7339920.1 hypothetical protein [Pseudomonas aeruginosa]MDF5950409.1 hypothetical protein [Pseudomonas aeruginosa]MDU7557511.1 hypothetical protein [Pseudomonas sp.]